MNNKFSDTDTDTDTNHRKKTLKLEIQQIHLSLRDRERETERERDRETAMAWGWLGPLSIKTKGGGRVSIFGLFFTLPALAAPALLTTETASSSKTGTEKSEREEEWTR